MNKVFTPEGLANISFWVSLALTAAHLFEEHQGKLWQYFGAIAGVRISDLAGRIFFTGGLGLLLMAAAFGIPYIHQNPNTTMWPSLCIGFLLGGRISDWLISHFLKRHHYKWDGAFLKNPGYFTSWFYLADAVLLGLLLGISWPAWSGWRLAAVLGFLAGAALFYVVIPTIKLLGKTFPKIMHNPPWVQDQPIPSWATQP